MKAASAKPDRFNLDITKWHLELRHQSQLRPRSVQGEPVTTGGTPAQLCTFRPGPLPRHRKHTSRGDPRRAGRGREPSDRIPPDARSCDAKRLFTGPLR
jgi:hypothetical protein